MHSEQTIVDRPPSMVESLFIGFLGADWWGSDARALAMAFRELGHLLVERHYEDYLSTRWQGTTLKIMRRLLRPLIAREYNRAVLELCEIKALDCLVVFKGMLLSPDTIRKFQTQAKPVYCVYPDVSFHAHDRQIWECLPLYDCVFTTKSYHLSDDSVVNRVRDIRLVRHGYDPEVHRPVVPTKKQLTVYGCDISFVGVWSPKKERALAELVRAFPNNVIRIWGPYWSRAAAEVRERWQRRSAHGDELALIHACSKINLGLLSEAGPGMSEGDRTTARTWQIPACGGLMLHENTPELLEAFDSGTEVEVFGGVEELVHKARMLLCDPDRRTRIQLAGNNRCETSGYTYARTAQAIQSYHVRQAGLS